MADHTVKRKSRYYMGIEDGKALFYSGLQLWQQKYRKPVIFPSRAAAMDLARDINERNSERLKPKCRASQLMWTNTNIAVN